MLKQLASKVRQKLQSVGKSNKDIFDTIYREHIWDGPGEVSSGSGSQPQNSKAYEDLIVAYVEEHGITSIVDVGCGDFQVSGRIMARLPEEVTYTGCDVSSVVIDHNTKKFATDRIAFRQVDASETDLPAGELVLMREVMQHLDNAAILEILPKLEAFPHAIVSNTIAKGAKPVNIDLAPGRGARAGIGSGLWLDKPPYNRPVEELLTTPHDNGKVEIVTVRLLSAGKA